MHSTSKGRVLTSVFDHAPFGAMIVSNFIIDGSGVVGIGWTTPSFSPLARIISLVAVWPSVRLVICVFIVIVILSLAPTRSKVIW